MGVNYICKGVLLGFLVILFCSGTFCQANDKIVEVVGEGECADCKEKNILMNQAYSGLHVTIDCKAKDGHFKQKGVGKLDKEGKFKITLNDGNDNEVCYAQLHSASSAPCPAHNGLKATKIVAKSDADGKNRFEPAEKLKFSADLCTSATWGPYFKHPPLPDSWKKHFGHHHLKSPPMHKKPEPEKPKPEAPQKPLPPSEPKKKKPEVPEKQSPPSPPKKSKSPSEKSPAKGKPPSEKSPAKEKPPSEKSPAKEKPPSEKSPAKEKPCPSVPEIPNTPKSPKIAKSPKIPDIPKSPPKFFFHHHHKFPYFPPLPPHAPHA